MCPILCKVMKSKTKLNCKECCGKSKPQPKFHVKFVQDYRLLFFEEEEEEFD